MRITITILFLFYSSVVFARTITVGSNLPVSSIQKAIAMASNGDTIKVMPGTYREGSIIIKKSITLIGINYPVLDGENKYENIVISGRDITVSGFVIRNSKKSSSNDYAGISIIDADNIRVEKNKILNAHFGIHLSNSINSKLVGNYIKGEGLSEQSAGNGIHIWKCEKILVQKNHITGHRDGIYFEFVTDSEIRDNISEKNIRYGLHFMFSHNDHYFNNIFRNNGAGVAVMYTHNVRMENNVFENNWGSASYGILLKDITDSRIINNRFISNTVGIYMEGSNRIEVKKNIFRSNGWALKVQANCTDNIFTLNNFFQNTFDVATNGTNVLSSFNNNYWDKYEGYDLNKNGIGDIPYHPVSMYSMIIEQNPTALLLLRSFMVNLLDKAEKAIPSLTPENLVDNNPAMKPFRL